MAWEWCYGSAPRDVTALYEAGMREMRTMMSWSRLVLQQGKREDARRMLAEVYGWFTEGFGTADLQEAKVLLDELSAP